MVPLQKKWYWFHSQYLRFSVNNSFPLSSVYRNYCVCVCVCVCVVFCLHDVLSFMIDGRVHAPSRVVNIARYVYLWLSWRQMMMLLKMVHYYDDVTVMNPVPDADTKVNADAIDHLHYFSYHRRNHHIVWCFHSNYRMQATTKHPTDQWHCSIIHLFLNNIRKKKPSTNR